MSIVRRPGQARPGHKRQAGIITTVFSLVLNWCGVTVAMEFADVTSATGMLAEHFTNKPSCGQAMADYDRDGREDILLTGYFFPNLLFLQTVPGTFSESPLSAQLNPPVSRCGAAAAADYNNDGWPDLYLACNEDNHLFRNDHGTGFTNVTAELQVNHGGNSEAVAWADINQDGQLDLFVGAYPSSSTPDLNDPDNLDQLWLSQPDGSYQNIAHLLDAATRARTALAAQFFDIDNDGDQDLYVVNDKLDGNSLWRNDGPGCGGWCLTDVARSSGADRPVFGMGIAAGDIDHDGDLDLYFSSIGEQVLLRNDLDQGSLAFTEISTAAGLNFYAVGWATHFADFNNDARLDAYLATGNIDYPYNTDRVYRNDSTTDSLWFADVAEASNASNAERTHGAAQWDYDGDGRQDLVVCNNNVDYRLYRNVSAEPGKWIELRLDGAASNINRDAIGSRITVSDSHGHLQLREVASGQARGGNSSLIQHFGVGDASDVNVRIRWPDGREDSHQLDSNSRYRLFYAEQLRRDGFE